jgi:hypothetical protein
MESREHAIAQFNAQAEAKGWLQVCDPGNAFILRECEELIELWNWARGGRALPHRDDLPARTLKPYLQRLSLVERIENDPPRFKFRLVGTVMTRSLSERTGQTFDDKSASTEQTERWTASALLSLALKEPLRFPTVIEKHMVGELLLLPLADDSGEARFVIAYGRYEPSRDWSVREGAVRAHVGA